MRQRALAVLASIAVLAGAGALALRGSWPWHRIEEQPAAPIGPVLTSSTDTLRSGEPLGALFGRHGIGPVELPEVVDLLGVDPRRVRAGQVFRFAHLEDDSAAAQITLRRSPTEQVRLHRGADDTTWVAEVHEIHWTPHPVRVVGTITTSLYDAMADARADVDLSTGDRINLAWDLADVFAWQVDFSRDLQEGDRFAVVFEEEQSDLGETRVGRVLASRLDVGGRALSAFFFPEDGRTEYFDAAGESLRRAFLRAPVEFRRISSGFSRARKHPILGIFRRHQGVDYAADAGTPVLAAADGTVRSAGWAGGYGRMIELRHRNGITTRYAHLRAFAKGLLAGRRVSQGEVIGYVGSSGLATAAHLHYEFRQNGVALDPRRVDPGAGEPVPADQRVAFLAERDRLLMLLRSPPAPVTVADGSD
jgi:murein DD-endopeptidase MepM/ murein hydrolase activator NlpD